MKTNIILHSELRFDCTLHKLTGQLRFTRLGDQAEKLTLTSHTPGYKSTARKRDDVLPTRDLVQIARGFLMGGADIIPGVSGGTVALILGIYERLVKAISRFDMTFLGHLRRRRWSAAGEHVDLRFLIALGCGIVSGILGLASLMHYLLEHQRQYTHAAFFGLILASSLLVAERVQRWKPLTCLCFPAGAVLAFLLVGLPLLQDPPPGNGYVFLCGVVAICAMILPGISGAFILLILGKYEFITGLLRDVLRGNITGATLLTLGVFCIGCMVGLLSFSKLLRWLLGRYESLTLAFLCGLMIGSLRRIWPFENVWPGELNAEVLLTAAIGIIAMIFVFELDRLTGTRQK